MTNTFHKKKLLGQGLIETLLIVLFVSGGVLALLSFEHYLSVNTSFSNQQSTATLVATNEMETLRNFTVLTTTAGYTAYSGIASGSGSSTVGNTTYTLTWTVTTTASPSYKTINLTVSWTDRNGNSDSVQLISIVAGLDPGTQASVY